MNTLSIGGIISQGFVLGLKNMLSLIGAVLLWLITIWIPYLNVGTTIALVSIVVAMSKGGVFSPTEIFDAKYRKYMGEFFLVLAIINIGVGIGMIFVLIPGIVIAIAWSMAVFLLIDRELNPMEAIKTSNQITYGHKWTIFIGMLLLYVILMILVFVLHVLGSMVSDTLGGILAILGVLVFLPVMLGAYSHIYGTLKQQPEQPA